MHSSARTSFKTISLIFVILCTRWWQQAYGILVIHKLNRHRDQRPRTPPGSNHNAIPALAVRGVAMESEARDIDVKMNTGLRPRESYHFARKIFHFTTIMAFAAMYSTKFSRWNLAKGLALMDACVLASELARLRISSVNRLFFRIFRPFMRAHELRKFSGIMYCLAGLGLTTAFFPKHIALLGMMQLAIGDPIAALCGHATRSVRWSRLRSGKGLIGAVGCTFVLTVANFVALVNASFEGMPQSVERLVCAAALIAIWTAFVEVAVPSPQKTLPCDGFPIAFDDNIVLPVLGALGSAVIFRLLELPDCQLRPWLLA